MKAWLEGNSLQAFFEFQANNTADDLDAELLYCRDFILDTVITIFFFNSSYFVTVTGTQDEQSVLKCPFPDVRTKGRGYIVKTFERGVKGWENLRKVLLWQTAESFHSEFVEKVTAFQRADPGITETKATSPARLARVPHHIPPMKYGSKAKRK